MLDNVPGPEASPAELRAHSRRVQDYIATHSHDAVKWLCLWCLSDDARTTSRVGTRGPNLFCGDRCAEGSDSYYVKVLSRKRNVPGG